ncbi:MAG: hypothetical protein Q7R39_03385 [Dehalococcoidia bacterium]|nr:hypothetical protein [Dehalococcoidia bacterium]
MNQIAQFRKPVALLTALFVALSFMLPEAGPALSAPEPPVRLSPADGSTTDSSSYPPYGVPTFCWAPVNGANNYEIQVSSTIGFTSGTVWVDQVTPNTTFTPTISQHLVNGTLYWRVRAFNGASWGSYNDTPWSFIKAWNLAPNLQSPENGASFQSFAYPVFSWLAVVGAARYKFELSGDPTFGSYSTGYPAYAYVPTFTPSAKLGNGTYYWRVTPLDRYGNSGQAAEVRSFTLSWNLAPTLLSPPSNPNGDPSQALPMTPRLSWSAVEGADHYLVQMSTGADFGTLVSPYSPLSTDNTSHTSTTALANDKDYFWRVKAVDRQGNEGPWSASSRFYLRWSYGPTGSTPDMRSKSLTPTNGAQNVGLPMFSWTPVQGAASYHLQVCMEPDSNCVDPIKVKVNLATPNTSYLYNIGSSWTLTPNTWYYWYVEAKGESDSLSHPVTAQRSDIFSFKTGDGALKAPNLIYPSYFYTPTVLQTETPYAQTSSNTFVTQTVAVPTFYWDRLPRTISDTTPLTYTIQVAANSAFMPIIWSDDTQNLSATPTLTDPFLAEDGGNYFWRVSGDGGVNWSQTWKTLIDTSQLATSSTLVAPTLLRPVYAQNWSNKWVGDEVVDTFPSLGWTAVLARGQVLAGNRYRVQVAKDSAFSDTIENVMTPYTSYTASSQPPFGTYYWRVRAEDGGGQPLTDWSSTGRFLLENQPQFVCSALDSGCGSPYPASDFPARSLLASDSAGDVADSYDLRTLYASVSKNYWLVGFRAAPGATPVRYALYIDTDHADGSGAVSGPAGLSIATPPAHRPEYAVLWDFNGGTVITPTLYTWVDPTGWGTPQTLSAVGASSYNPGDGFIEYAILKTALNEPGVGPAYSLSLAAASVDLNTGSLVDTVPTGQGGLDNFASVSLAPSPVVPVNGAAPALATTPRFSWGTIDGAWTYRFQAAKDSRFSTVLYYNSVTEEGSVPNTMLYDGRNPYYSPRTAWGDNQTIYWRLSTVNPWGGGEFWGKDFQFSLAAFVPQNPRISTDFTMPTFSWDPVEGAILYEFQLDNDADFSSPIKDIETETTSYTPEISLPAGDTFYWRVRMKKGTASYGAWTAMQTFTRWWLTPGSLRVYTDDSGIAAGQAVTRTPTLGWNKVLTTTIGAAGYKVEVSTQPGFVSLYDWETTDTMFYTPSSGSDGSKSTYADGTYYLRVRPVDAGGTLGNPSTPVTITKQYPQATLLEPGAGATTMQTPTFKWSTVQGAAWYEIQIATDPNFTQNLIKQVTDNVSYTPVNSTAWSDSKSAYRNKSVYWRVAMVDANANYGPYSGSTVILGYGISLPTLSKFLTGGW